MAHARRLKLEDPRIVQKYNDKLHELLMEKKVYERLTYLHQKAVYPQPLWMEYEYEAIDIIIQQSMEKAEKQCRKFKCGNVPWSPLYQEIYDTIDYWNLRLDQFQKQKNKSTQLLIRLQKRLSIRYTRLTKVNIKKN